MRIHIKRGNSDLMLRFVVDPPVLRIRTAHQEGSSLDERETIFHFAVVFPVPAAFRSPGLRRVFLRMTLGLRCIPLRMTLRLRRIPVCAALRLRRAPVRSSEGAGILSSRDHELQQDPDDDRGHHAHSRRQRILL